MKRRLFDIPTSGATTWAIREVFAILVGLATGSVAGLAIFCAGFSGLGALLRSDPERDPGPWW